jgi:hypothetical protein
MRARAWEIGDVCRAFPFGPWAAIPCLETSLKDSSGGGEGCQTSDYLICGTWGECTVLLLYLADAGTAGELRV